MEIEHHGQEDVNVKIITEINQPSSQSIPGPLTSQEIEALIDEDPLAAIDSLIGKALSKSSTKTQQSSVQEVIQPKDQVTQKLDSLRSIIFKKGLLKNLPKDPTLRDDIRQAFQVVEDISSQLSPEQTKGVKNAHNIFERCLVTIDKVENVQAEFQRLEHIKIDKVSRLREAREKLSNLQTGIKSAEDKEKKFDAEISELEAKLKMLKEDRAHLKTAREKCMEQKKECISTVKILSGKVAKFFG